jgi:hypothetical protein
MHWPYHKGSWMLGSTRMHLGRYDDARVQGQVGLALAQEIGVRVSGIAGGRQAIGFSLAVLGQVALAEGAYGGAQALLQESLAAYRKVQDRGFEGQALALLGIAERGLGDLDRAAQLFCCALRTVTTDAPFFPLLYALPAAALLLVDRSEAERAVELYTLASCYAYVANSRWFEDVVGVHIAAAASALPPDVVAAARERGRARDPVATAAKLLAELENVANDKQ